MVCFVGGVSRLDSANFYAGPPENVDLRRESAPRGHFGRGTTLGRELRRRISPQRYGQIARSDQHLAGNFALFPLVGTLTAQSHVFRPEFCRVGRDDGNLPLYPAIKGKSRPTRNGPWSGPFSATETSWKAREGPSCSPFQALSGGRLCWGKVLRFRGLGNLVVPATTVDYRRRGQRQFVTVVLRVEDLPGAERRTIL